MDEAAEFYYEEDLYLEYPDDKYSCPICLCPVQVEAHLTECCGRHFCLPCIGRIRDERKPCPLCKESSLVIFPNKERQREIRQIRVRCPLSLPCYRDLYDSDVDDANSLSGDESYGSTDDEECNSDFDEEISVENDGTESSCHDSDTDTSLNHDPQDLDDDDHDSNELDAISFDQPLQEEEDEATSSGVLSNDDEEDAESSHEFCVESDCESVVSDDNMIEDSFPTDEVQSDASYAFDEGGSVCSDTPLCDWTGELGQIENHVLEVHGEGMLKLLTNDVDYSTGLQSTSEEEILPDEDSQLYSEHTPVQQTATILQGLESVCTISDVPPTAANPQLQAIASPESTQRLPRIEEIMKRTCGRAESDSSSSVVGTPQTQQSSSLPLNHGAGGSIQHSTLQQPTHDAVVVHKSVQHRVHVTDVPIQHVNTLQQPRHDTVIVQNTVCVRDCDQGASRHTQHNTHPIQQATPVTVVVHESVRHHHRPRRRAKNHPPQDSSPGQTTHPTYVQQATSHPSYPQCVLQAFNPHHVYKSNTQDGSASWYRERQQGPARPKQSKRHHARSGKQAQTSSQKSAQTSLQTKAPGARQSSKSRRAGESAGSTTALKQLRRSSRDKDASTNSSRQAKPKSRSQNQLQVGGSEKVTIQVSNSILNVVQGGSLQLPLDSIQGLSRSAASHTQSGSSKGHSSKKSKPTSSQGSRARAQKSAQSRSQGSSKSSKSQKPPDSQPRTGGSQKGSPNEQSRKKQSGTQTKSAHNKSSKTQSHSQSDTSKSRGHVAQKGACKEQNSTAKSSQPRQVQKMTPKSGPGSQKVNPKNSAGSSSQAGSSTSINVTLKIEAAVLSQNTVPSSQRRNSSKGQSRDTTQSSHQAAHASNPSKKSNKGPSIASPRERPKAPKQPHSSSQGAANAARPPHKQKQSQGATKGSSHQRGHSQKKPCAK